MSTRAYDAGEGITFEIPASFGDPELQSLPDGRKLILAADSISPDFNVFFVKTPIQADYNSLGSFGNLDYVGATLLPQCPTRVCSLEQDGIAGRMVEQASTGGQYIFEYIIEQQGQPSRRLRTAMAIAPGKALLTYTAQCLDSEFDANGSTIRSLVKSFRFNPT